jgi:hypothetical protein
MSHAADATTETANAPAARLDAPVPLDIERDRAKLPERSSTRESGWSIASKERQSRAKRCRRIRLEERGTDLRGNHSFEPGSERIGTRGTSRFERPSLMEL